MTVNLSRLNHWQQVAFSAALMERMLPNLFMFYEVTEFGEPKLLRNQLDLVWQWLDKNQSCKINYNAQLAKLEPLIPDPEQFDSFGVFPAIDVTMAMISLLQGMQDKELENFDNVAQLSLNSVNFYCELELSEHEELEQAELDQAIEQHPLMQWELATQQQLFDFIANAPETKASCKEAKAMVLEEGMSNLGIEIS
ncbi:YjaG family protein [Thalassotalea sp. LPB0316]|uniref:YjaG family protein n=1 Tax=Thalassotalea sp. LPB0316 TaxID=2769490 RepID=UPI001868A120|nr:YjaG family protein [Thalassotalea sp. LPB0316]QOL26331.1 YjaG family protein [Thalassotalea sp. LPB0316]